MTVQGLQGSTVLASDLDRTLIYSPSALQLPGTDEQAPTLVSVEVIEGRPHSFMTLTTALRLAALSRQSVFVPTTTRTIAQFRRIGFVGITHGWAITSNGGNILRQGVPDRDWNAAAHAGIAGTGASLAEVKDELKHRSDPAWMLKRRTGDDLFCYAVVDIAQLPTGFIDDWRAWCDERGWRVSVQGRKIYAIPGSLSKENALAEVKQRAGASTVLASGDGALDAGFLAAATAGLRPPHGELAAVGWTHPTVAVTEHAGVLAADDITAWFADRVGLDLGDLDPDALAAAVAVS
ncbi:HAD family hydrolase [Nakamurella sp. YIM 132087]|uniref:HAD family hydrolase n=1 Tax=Nakamurella alba TaxID=2665158 RepID=A0A7K1FQB1_9ACTN|nr:HAD family hydrolase [Nakamurella alba]MTD14984.1 HAD family hydrolase [Nakamurella alba]